MSETWNKFKRAIKGRRIPWMRVLVVMVGLLWLHSALEKLLDPAYVDGFAGTMFFFGMENPNAWYVDFLNGFVIPNAAAFAMVIAIGELLVGISFVLGGLTRFGAIGGILLTVNFFFAASHVSPAVWSINLLLIGLQLVFIFSKEAKELSVDQLVQSKLSKRLGTPGRKALDIVIGAPAGAA